MNPISKEDKAILYNSEVLGEAIRQLGKDIMDIKRRINILEVSKNENRGEKDVTLH